MTQMASSSRFRPAHEPMLPLQESARAAVSLLQSCLAEVIAALPGFSPSARAVDIQRLLDLDKKLGWQLHKFLSAPNPLAELASVPGEPSMRRILVAAAQRNVSQEVTDRAAEAFKQFESLVAENAKDRFELISLTNGLAATGGTGGVNGSDQQRDLSVRKTAFKCMSHLWGIKADTSIRSAGFAPGDGDTQQTFAVRAEIGLQRLRHGVPLTVFATSRNRPTSGEPSLSPWQIDQGDAGAANNANLGMHLIEDLCTQPLPRMSPRVSPEGNIETEIEFPPSGRSGAVTLYGYHHVAATSAGAQARYSQGITVRIPCERLHLELLVPQGWSDPHSVRVSVYGRRDRIDRNIERRVMDILPQREIASYLGVMETAPLIPGVPQHARAVQHVLDQVNWPGARFDIYRCTVEYPLLHAMISLDVDAMPAAR